MGRLKGKGLPSRLSAPPSRLASKGKPEQTRSQLRDQSNVSRSWYKTTRWQKLRLKVLARDHFTCQQTGVALVGRYPAPNSAVADHIRPHRGDPALFWDEDNIQSVSKAYHDKEKQRLEARGLA